MKATNKNLNCSVLSGEERRYYLRQRISEVYYEDISPCLYAERPDKSMLGLKSLKKIVKTGRQLKYGRQIFNTRCSLGRRYSTARVSKRPTDETAACLRARYCNCKRTVFSSFFIWFSCTIAPPSLF